jgi:cytochrome c
MLKGLQAGILIFAVLIEQTPNHIPVVSISQPANHSVYTWNNQVPYAVDVSDTEDGDSKYQEIQSTEVLVRLKYTENAAQASAYLKQKKFNDTIGLMNMMVSNCFNCHGFKSKIAGPSFQDISRKYPNIPENREQLENHILTGSTGIWGKEVMPTHPELKAETAQKMVQWILTYSNSPGLDYFVGLKGVLPLNKPRTNLHSGAFVVTAFYTDHGTVEHPDRRLTGAGQAVLKVN